MDYCKKGLVPVPEDVTNKDLMEKCQEILKRMKQPKFILPLREDDSNVNCFSLLSARSPAPTTSATAPQSSPGQVQVRVGPSAGFRIGLTRLLMCRDNSTTDAVRAGVKTVSHLCHDHRCVNPEHLVLETLQYNQARNVCEGPAGCSHDPPCLTQGSSFASQESIVSYDEEEQSFVRKQVKRRRTNNK